MPLGGCYQTWSEAPVNKRAPVLDSIFPNCVCESVPLHASGGHAVNDNERIARILTSPGAFDLKVDQILTQKLSSVYASGLSVIRTGASDDEIKKTIDVLMNSQAEPQALIGAALVHVDEIRKVGSEARWFGVYATEEEEKKHHADIMGTTPPAESNNQRRVSQDSRRYELRDMMATRIIRSADAEELISLLRQAGI